MFTAKVDDHKWVFKGISKSEFDMHVAFETFPEFKVKYKDGQ
jgi:hypothetical protein